jgi:hypothetical protein
MQPKGAFVVVLTLAGMLSGGYIGSVSNALERRDEQVKQAWDTLLATYQQRADTIPALYSAIKDMPVHELTTLLKRKQAQIAARKIESTAHRPEDLYDFLQIQRDIRIGIERMLAVGARIPDDQAKSFLELQQKITDLNVQIMACQRRFMDEVKGFNADIRDIPTKWIADYKGIRPKRQFTFGNETEMRHVPRWPS